MYDETRREDVCCACGLERVGDVCLVGLVSLLPCVNVMGRRNATYWATVSLLLALI